MSETINARGETGSETANEGYNIWQQKMNEVAPFGSADRETSKAEGAEGLSDDEALDKLFKTLNAEHKELLKTGDIKHYGGSLDSFDYRIDDGGDRDALGEQMDLLVDAANMLNDPEEYGETDATLLDVLLSMANDRRRVWEESERQYGSKDRSTRKFEKSYDIAYDLFKRFEKTKLGEEADDADDGMQMEEMPAGKSEVQERLERSRVKIDDEFKARLEAYRAEQRANEQKEREGQERIQKERAEAEARRQKIIREQREKVKNAYRRELSKQLEEEQEDEMEMEM